MKRPLAVTGFAYLVTLAVIFHFYSEALVLAVVIAAPVSALAAVIFKLFRRNTRVHIPVIACAVSCLAAMLSLFLFQNYKVQPVLDSYAGRELYVEGYLKDRLNFNGSFVSGTMQAEKIDGKECDVKINVTMRLENGFEPFEKFAVTVTPEASGYTYTCSRGVYLYAYVHDDAKISGSGEWHEGFDKSIADVRKYIERVLEQSLDENGASVAKAVLLGNKAALPDDVNKAFTDTGTSYLIVVSGMHLAVITLFIRRILNLLPLNGWLIFIMISVVIFLFAAVAGFPPSVLRAGIMLAIIYLAKAINRKADSINSLGIAAFALTVINPYSVGDIGLLLSFSATLGILLWADGISGFLLKLFKLNYIKRFREEKGAAAKLVNLIKQLTRRIIMLFAVSLAGTLWVMPVTMVFFSSVAPFSAVISIAAYPLTCAVLLASALLIVLQFAAPLKWFINSCAGLLIALITWFSGLPFCNIEIDEGFYWVWLAVSAVLTAAGYLIHAGKAYVLSAIIISVLTLTIGGSLTYLFADSSAVLTVYRFGRGSTATVRKGDNISFLSCGGTKNGREMIQRQLRRTGTVDNIILAGNSPQTASYIPAVLENAAVSNFFYFDKNSEGYAPYENGSELRIVNNTSFTVALNSEVSVKVLCTGSRVLRYVYSDSVSVLLLPDYTDIAKLPEEMRGADIVIAEGRVYNAELYDNGKLIMVGEDIPDGGSIRIDFR